MESAYNSGLEKVVLRKKRRLEFFVIHVRQMCPMSEKANLSPFIQEKVIFPENKIIFRISSSCYVHCTKFVDVCVGYWRIADVADVRSLCRVRTMAAGLGCTSPKLAAAADDASSCLASSDICFGSPDTKR